MNFPQNKYKVIYADPPWSFATYSDKGKGRSAERHYECMSLEDIQNLPVSSIAERDCVLFLWVTDPFLKIGLDLIETWGFKFKTVGFYWVKVAKGCEDGFIFDEDDLFMGNGYWTRANPEQCLLATRGAPAALARDVRRLVIAPRAEHSHKPAIVRERIERLCAGPYIELFARETSPNWGVWGNETGKFR